MVTKPEYSRTQNPFFGNTRTQNPSPKKKTKKPTGAPPVGLVPLPIVPFAALTCRNPDSLPEKPPLGVPRNQPWALGMVPGKPPYGSSRHRSRGSQPQSSGPQSPRCPARHPAATAAHCPTMGTATSDSISRSAIRFLIGPSPVVPEKVP